MDGISLIKNIKIPFSNRFKIIQAGLVALLLCNAHTIEFENNYFTKSSIQLTTAINSPAFAALEDLSQTYTEYNLNPGRKSLDRVPLQWGENKNLWVLKNLDLVKYTMQAHELSTMRISSQNITNKIKKVDPLARVLEPPAEVLAEQAEKLTKIESEEVHPVRVALANKIMQAAYSPENRDTFSQKSKLDKDLEAIISKEKSKVYQGEEQILIAGNEVSKYGNSNQLLTRMQKSSKKKSHQEKYEKHLKKYMIRGSLEFAKGLGEIIDHNQIRIYRQDEGEEVELAFVDLNKKYFEINVNELTGYLIAEAYDRKGVSLIGYAQIDLLDKDMSTVSLRETVLVQDLTITSASEALILKAISGESTADVEVSLLEKNVKGNIKREQTSVSVEVDGLEESQDLDKTYNLKSDMFTKDSNMLMKLEARNHWGSLAVGLGYSDNKIRMYKNNLVDALLDNYKESHDGYGVVWGRVLDEDGKPIAGAEVEMAGDLSKGPFYFNQAHLVDYKLGKTNYDGLFAFVKVLPGLQATRAIINGKELPVELTVVDNKMVSYIEIRAVKAKHISVTSYDPIRKNKVDISYKLIGSEKIYETYSGEKNIELWGGNKGINLLESDPGDGYRMTRHVINRKLNHHDIPTVSSAWIQSVFKARSVFPNNDKGIIVGYVGGENFEVYSNADLDGWSKKDIIYFDEKGRVLPKNLGRSGGGFIMYNVPESLSSVSILANINGKVFTSMVLSDRDYISVLNTNF